MLELSKEHRELFPEFAVEWDKAVSRIEAIRAEMGEMKAAYEAAPATEVVGNAGVDAFWHQQFVIQQQQLLDEISRQQHMQMHHY